MYDPPMPESVTVSAFVLAGGHSSRMGEDKALLKFGQMTLLERTLACAQNVADNVAIVGSKARYGAYGIVVEDIYPGSGPLGGIHAALRHTQTDMNLMLAVDLPGLSVHFLQFLISIAQREHEAQAIVPEYDGRRHPLCAVYRRQFADAAENALQHKRFRIDLLFDQVPTRKITQAELESAGFAGDIFRNVNTKADLEAARATQST